jgi:hypothetical protein
MLLFGKELRVSHRHFFASVGWLGPEGDQVDDSDPAPSGIIIIGLTPFLHSTARRGAAKSCPHARRVPHFLPA